MSKPKTLYRSEDNRVIAGVCAGLGEYFEVDPTLVRIAFILLAAAGGSAVFLYIVLWVLVPTKSSKTVISDTMLKENLSEMKDTAQQTAEKVAEETKKAADTVKEKIQKPKK